MKPLVLADPPLSGSFTMRLKSAQRRLPWSVRLITRATVKNARRRMIRAARLGRNEVIVGIVEPTFSCWFENFREMSIAAYPFIVKAFDEMIDGEAITYVTKISHATYEPFAEFKFSW